MRGGCRGKLIYLPKYLRLFLAVLLCQPALASRAQQKWCWLTCNAHPPQPARLQTPTILESALHTRVFFLFVVPTFCNRYAHRIRAPYAHFAPQHWLYTCKSVQKGERKAPIVVATVEYHESSAREECTTYHPNGLAGGGRGGAGAACTSGCSWVLGACNVRRGTARRQWKRSHFWNQLPARQSAFVAAWLNWVFARKSTSVWFNF